MPISNLPAGTPAPTAQQSPTDEYSTPIPQGATSQAPAAPSQDEYSTPIPQGANTDQQAPSAHSDEIQINPNDSLLTKGVKGVGGLLEGAGEGIFSTAAGLADTANKYLGDGKPGAVSNTLHTLAGDDNTERGAVQKWGYGGETLAEFMLGDEALKGLSMADRLGVVSKWMKVAEKSPRLIKAMRTGADLAKVQADLSPEEIALVQKYPKLAKLVHIGVTATRAGVTQGVQSTIRSGGDLEQGATDAALTAATAGAIHGTVGAAASALGKAGKASETIRNMGLLAEGAPTRTAVEGQVADAANDAFSGETGTLQNNLDDATSTVGMFGEGAPATRALALGAQQTAKAVRQSLSADYQAGLDHLTELAQDNTIPYEGSPWHRKVQQLVQEGTSNSGPLDQALNVTRPGSDKVNRILDKLNDLNGDAGEEEESSPGAHSLLNDFITPSDASSVASEGEETQPAALGMKHLVEYRQKIARLLRDVSPTSPDARADKHIYTQLLEGVDQTIGQLADTVGEDETGEGPSQGRQVFDQMNQKYNDGIQPFKNRDVRNIMKGNLNDVAKTIMGGQTSIDDINAVKKALGANNFQRFSTASLQNIVQSFTDKETGEVDYKKLFQKFDKIDPQVRATMFGDQGKALHDALNVANQSANGLGEIGKTVQDILGNGDIDSLMQSPERTQNLAKAVGPNGMKVLGRSIMENKIREASTALDAKTGEYKSSHFDPDKVLEWWNSMKDTPEVRDAFFTIDKDTKQHYDAMISDLAQASSVKKLVKYGVLPVTLGTAGVVHGPGAALIGAIAGLGTEASFGRARDILDSIANNPRTWKLLGYAGKLGKAADVADTGKAADAVKNASAATVFNGLSDNLGGKTKPKSTTENAKPNPNEGTDDELPEQPKEAINQYPNPEDQPPEVSLAFNKSWTKPDWKLTQLSPANEAKFQEWAKKNPKSVEGQLNNPKADYDVRAHWLAAQRGDPDASLVPNKWDGTLHGSDKFKTPYNGGFSNESMYATKDAPRWVGDRLMTKDGRLVTDETPRPKKSGKKKLTSLADGTASADAAASPDAATVGNRAIEDLPPEVRNAVTTIPVKVTNGATMTDPNNRGGGQTTVANVDQGAGNNTVEINSPKDFQKNPTATMGHEVTHVWQNNLPPSVQAKIPDDPKDMSAFDISDVDKLRKQGKTMVDIPREKAATIVQKYIEAKDPKVKAKLKPWIDDMGKTALSSTMPTAPDAKKLNMTPRPPGLPDSSVAGMYRSLSDSLGSGKTKKK